MTDDKPKFELNTEASRGLQQDKKGIALKKCLFHFWQGKAFGEGLFQIEYNRKRCRKNFQNRSLEKGAKCNLFEQEYYG